MIDANGRLGEAPTPLLGNSCRPDFDDNALGHGGSGHLSRFRCRRGHPGEARSTILILS